MLLCFWCIFGLMCILQAFEEQEHSRQMAGTSGAAAALSQGRKSLTLAMMANFTCFYVV